ncbi:2-oxo acid dehydrogenase subunit E2 [bacterium]|nr:2-oxo acid dehydrogenase subunit E2 [bacterium]
MDDFELFDFPRSRRATFDVGKIGLKKHHVVGLLEIDVTNAQRKIKETKNSGRRISFTSWFVKAVGHSVADSMHSHAIRYKKDQLIAFKEIDISIPVEREVNGVKVPIATIIRRANHKTVEEIYSDIKTSVKTEIQKDKDFVLTERKSKFSTGLFFFLPQWIRMLIWKRILNNPFSIKKNMGTVIITNVGMFGNFAGWIIPKSIHNLCIGIGSIVNKPWVVNDQIEIRSILHLSILFDHDAIDGAPATRFTQCLVENIESAIGI